MCYSTSNNLKESLNTLYEAVDKGGENESHL